jgi:hypothetical protein
MTTTTEPQPKTRLERVLEIPAVRELFEASRILGGYHYFNNAAPDRWFTTIGPLTAIRRVLASVRVGDVALSDMELGKLLEEYSKKQKLGQGA